MAEYLPSPEGPIHLREHGGTGPLVVAIHGLGGSLASWDAVVPPLTDRFRVIAMDLPGFGLTPPRSDYELTTHVEAIFEVVKQCGAPAVLIGNSLGGLLAEMAASQRPDLISALVLISPATPPRLPDPDINWAMAARLAINSIPGVGEVITRYVMSTRTSEELIDESLERITAGKGRVPMEIVDAFVQNAEARRSLPWSTEAIPKTGRSIRRYFSKRSVFVEMVRSIAAPTLVIQGVHDPIVSPNSVAWLCSLRSDWDLRQMEDTGHTPQIDAPVRTRSIIRPWLEQRLGAAQSA